MTRVSGYFRPMVREPKNICFYTMRKDETVHVSDVIKHDLSRTLRSIIRLHFFMFSILALSIADASAQLRVGLHTQNVISSVLVSPVEGRYFLLNALSDTVYRFRSDDAISLTASGNTIIVRSAYGLNDTLETAYLTGTGNRPSIKTRLNDEKEEHPSIF